MKKSLVCLFLVAAFMLLADCPFVHAQAVGTITGTITDPSGGVIPGAKVTATRVETGVSQSTVTTSAGIYTLPSLVVGTYKVVVETVGFKPGEAREITLDVAQVRAVDFTLVMAGVTSTVQVSAAPPLLNTSDGTIAGIVEGSQVQALPLNGRSIANLVTLQPGMAADTGSMGWFAPQWISNGNRGESTVATLDGVDSSDREMGTIQFWDFNLDAIAEFKVQQNNYSAQYGQGAGTITQIVSKTGTNQWHGSAFEFVRNNDLDARNFFSTTTPPLQRNEYGGVIGGPLKKDKTFIFGEYAGFRQLAGEPDIILVPTAAERQGQITIADPVTGQPDNLQVPLNSVAQGILSDYPMPNQPNGIYGANTFNFQLKAPTNNYQWSVRLDQHISDKDSFFARASYINHTALETDPVAAIENPSWSATLFNNPRNYSISETHILSPTLLNTFYFTLNRQIEGDMPPNQDVAETTTLDGSLANYGADTFTTKYVETYFEPSDMVSWTKGRHTFNIGGKFEKGWDNGEGVGLTGPNGIYTFNSGTALLKTIPSTNGGTSLAAGSPSPSGLVSMMEGDDVVYARTTTVPGFGPSGVSGVAWWGMRVWHLAGWFQDDIKVTPRLTVNAGLRYEYNSVPYEQDNRIAGFGNPYGTLVLNPRPMYQPDYNNLGPRFGIAYRLPSKTVLRGGFGVFTNMIPTVYPDQAAVNFPMAALSDLASAPYSLTPLNLTLPALTTYSGQVMPPNGNTKLIPPNTPVDLAPYTNVTGLLASNFASDTMRNGYTMSGNATVEHEFPGSVELTVSYVMNNGVHLWNTAYPNAYTGAEPQYTPISNVTPGEGELQLYYNGASSNYNALQVQARRTAPSHGLQFQANYTWGRTFDDADDVWAASGTSGATTLNNPQCLKCEYAPASFSVAQRFVANAGYNLPLAGHGLPNRLAEGWKMMGIVAAQTGFPFTVVGPYGTLAYGYDTDNGVGARPFFLQKATRASAIRQPTGPQFFSSQVIGLSQNDEGIGTGFFGLPTTTSPYAGGAVVQTAPGNLGRNTFTGPGFANLDFSVIKDTRITERMSLEIRAEFFNILNHSTFASASQASVYTSTAGMGSLGSPQFGLITATATIERQIQFGARLIF